VIDSVVAAGLTAVECGAVPTPALAMAAMARGQAAIMVTGSHIPADRNGLKFYTARGEITTDDEARIAALAATETAEEGPAAPQADPGAAGRYRDRYLAQAPADALAGLGIGVYQHSTVARDLLADLVRALGGEPVPLGRSDHFIPVDTEAVDPATRAQLRAWAGAQRLDAIISADGDADRPLVADETGEVIPGDILGTLTAQTLGADCVVTPVSSNTMVEATGAFARVIRTRIGSPFVIAAMAAAGGRAVGFEANGGFLLGFRAGALAPLMTRDAVLPILSCLSLIRARGLPLSAIVAGLPARRTATDRLENVATDRSQALVAALTADAAERARFFAGFGAERSVDLTDGLRVTFADGRILHVRPSGNAPELRAYAEAGSDPAAQAALADLLARLRARLG
jgi:phosphomannomutase